MSSIFDREAEPAGICPYCKQPKTNHAITCLYGGADPEVLDYSTPAAQLARKWRTEPDESVWRTYRRDESGNPVLSRRAVGLPDVQDLLSERAVFLNGGLNTFAAPAGFAGDGE
jgi:hypothetical protein